MPRTPGRPPAPAAAPNRDALLAMAFDEFANKPYDNVSLRALARKADVSDSLLNHYFGSKERLWQAVVAHYVTSGFADVRESLAEPQAAPPLAALQHHIRALMTLACKQPNVIRLVFNALNDNAARADHLRYQYLHPYLRQLDRQLDRCREHGLIKPLTSQAIHAAILGWVHILIQPTLLYERPESNREPPELVIADLMTLMMNGLIQEQVTSTLQNADVGGKQRQ